MSRRIGAFTTSIRLNPNQFMDDIEAARRETAAQHQAALYRASAAVAHLFQIPPVEAAVLATRLCEEQSIYGDLLEEWLAGGRILMHPDRFLAVEPMEQTWVIPTGTRRFYSSGRAFITNAGIQIPVQWLNISIQVAEQGLPRCVVELNVSSREFDLRDRLWFRSIPIIGTVIESRTEQSIDDFTHLVQLQIPVVEEIREADDDGSRRRILRVSEAEYQRRSTHRMVDTGRLQRSFLPFATQTNNIKPKACNGCRHYHGQTYGGNFLVCGMHPSGVEGDECPDRDSSIPQPSNATVINYGSSPQNIDIRTFGGD